MIIVEFDELIPDSDVSDATPVEITAPGIQITEVVAVNPNVDIEDATRNTIIQVDQQPTIEVITRTGDTVIVTGGMGPPGPPGAAGAAPQAYVHEQIIPESTWFVAHNLGFFPNVTVIDSGGNQIIGEATYLDNTGLLITFTASFGGVAYLS